MLNPAMRGPSALILAIVSGLRVAACTADEVIFHGNLHTSINDTTLEINALDQLVVDNLGPAGRDGVSIALGQAAAFDLHIIPQPPGLPVGATERLTHWGSVSGTPGVRVASMGFTLGTGNLAIDATFPGLGSPPRIIEVYFEGVLVGAATMTGTVAQVATVPAAGGWPSVVGVRRNQSPQNRPVLVCRWPHPVLLTLAAGPVLSGDELRVVGMTPQNTLDFVAQTDGTGSDVPELFIAMEDTQPTCPGDLDGDGDVDVADLAILLANFGSMANVTAAEGDLDHDGDVDIADLSLMLTLFGTTC